MGVHCISMMKVHMSIASHSSWDLAWLRRTVFTSSATIQRYGHFFNVIISGAPLGF